MLTAIVSDLHLGTTSGADIALRPEVRERLAQALAGADRIVLLGDLLELRERPMAPAVLELAAPVRSTPLGQAAAGKQVVIVPGNHDHELVAPALEAARLDDAGSAGAGGQLLARHRRAVAARRRPHVRAPRWCWPTPACGCATTCTPPTATTSTCT